jgi:hypothetical protein
MRWRSDKPLVVSLVPAELGKATSTRNLSSWFSERVRKIFDLERA